MSLAVVYSARSVFSQLSHVQLVPRPTVSLLRRSRRFFRSSRPNHIASTHFAFPVSVDRLSLVEFVTQVLTVVFGVVNNLFVNCRIIFHVE